MAKVSKPKPVKKNSLTNPETIYSIKITLQYSKPSIWRRLLMPDVTLDLLHHVIQVAMPWEQSHLWEFRIGRETRIGLTMKELGMNFDEDNYDAEADQITIGNLVEQNAKKLIYTYDFGDSWDHDVVIEKTVPYDPTIQYPICIAGKNAGPPEDCGGMGGYYNLVEALRNKKHPEHHEMLEWHGEVIDPTEFNIDSVNLELRRVFKSKR